MGPRNKLEMIADDEQRPPGGRFLTFDLQLETETEQQADEAADENEGKNV